MKAIASIIRFTATSAQVSNEWQGQERAVQSSRLTLVQLRAIKTRSVR